MPRIEEILSRPGSDWEVLTPPLPTDVVEDARVLIGCPLPAGLLELYHLCNGGQGSLRFQPWLFILWDLEFVVQVRKDEHYQKYFAPYIFFGTNGGGEYFGIDPSGRVFFMDPIAGEDSIVFVAESLTNSLRTLAPAHPTTYQQLLSTSA